MKKVCMLGSGAWGTAVSALLADNGLQVKMWCYDPEVAKSVEIKHCNELYFPGEKLSTNIKPVTNIGVAMSGCEVIFEATPVKFLRSVLQKAKPYFNSNQIWVILSKGIESETLLFPSQIIDSVFGDGVKKVVLSGPSFACDLISKKLTAVEIAQDLGGQNSGLQNLSCDLQKILENDYFRVFVSDDIFGLQVGGALKNVAAIIVGMLDTTGCGDNTRAFALVACLRQIEKFAQLCGAERKTLYGLSGLGDLVLTCSGKQSRNFAIGQRIGCGEKLRDIAKEGDGVLPEGINTLESVHKIILFGCPSFGGGPVSAVPVEYKLKHNVIWGDRLETVDLQAMQEELGDKFSTPLAGFPLFECAYDIVFADKKVSDLIAILKNTQLFAGVP